MRQNTRYFVLYALIIRHVESVVLYDVMRIFVVGYLGCGYRCGIIENWWEVGIFDMLPEPCGG